MRYEDFLKQKDFKNVLSGFDIDRNELHEMLFDFQKDIVRFYMTPAYKRRIAKRKNARNYREVVCLDE